MPVLTNVTVGQFCREMVCGLEPLPQLFESWGIDEETYLALRKNEFFQKELKAAVAEVKDMGPDSTFIVRCKVLSETFLTDMIGLMSDRMTPAEVKLGLFKQITELARLHAPKSTPGQQNGPAGPLVTFTFGPGMPGLPEKLVISSPVQEIEGPRDPFPR